MNLNLSNKHQDKIGYIITSKSFNNLDVFNRPEDLEERCRYMDLQFNDKNVYLFIDKRQPGNLVLPFNINLNFKPIYIGKGYFDSIKETNARAVRHHRDLLSQLLKKDPKRYECIQFNTGMTDIEASCLEAFWIGWLIDEQNFSLSTSHVIGDLINKRRELLWESRAEKILKLENKWRLPKIY